MAHPTTVPKQSQTDHYLVFRNTDHGTLELVRQVEVPQYSQPSADGVRLDREKRLALAVNRAVMGMKWRKEDLVFVGEEFEVMSDIEQDEFETVVFEKNPAFDAVWDPENND